MDGDDRDREPQTPTPSRHGRSDEDASGVLSELTPAIQSAIQSIFTGIENMPSTRRRRAIAALVLAVHERSASIDVEGSRLGQELWSQSPANRPRARNSQQIDGQTVPPVRFPSTSQLLNAAPNAPPGGSAQLDSRTSDGHNIAVLPTTELDLPPLADIMNRLPGAMPPVSRPPPSLPDVATGALDDAGGAIDEDGGAIVPTIEQQTEAVEVAGSDSDMPPTTARESVPPADAEVLPSGSDPMELDSGVQQPTSTAHQGAASAPSTDTPQPVGGARPTQGQTARKAPVAKATVTKATPARARRRQPSKKDHAFRPSSSAGRAAATTNQAGSRVTKGTSNRGRVYTLNDLPRDGTPARTTRQNTAMRRGNTSGSTTLQIQQEEEQARREREFERNRAIALAGLPRVKNTGEYARNPYLFDQEVIDKFVQRHKLDNINIHGVSGEKDLLEQAARAAYRQWILLNGTQAQRARRRRPGTNDNAREQILHVLHFLVSLYSKGGPSQLKTTVDEYARRLPSAPSDQVGVSRHFDHFVRRLLHQERGQSILSHTDHHGNFDSVIHLMNNVAHASLTGRWRDNMRYIEALMFVRSTRLLLSRAAAGDPRTADEINERIRVPLFHLFPPHARAALALAALSLETSLTPVELMNTYHTQSNAVMFATNRFAGPGAMFMTPLNSFKVFDSYKPEMLHSILLEFFTVLEIGTMRDLTTHRIYMPIMRGFLIPDYGLSMTSGGYTCARTEGFLAETRQLESGLHGISRERPFWDPRIVESYTCDNVDIPQITTEEVEAVFQAVAYAGTLVEQRRPHDEIREAIRQMLPRPIRKPKPSRHIFSEDYRDEAFDEHPDEDDDDRYQASWMGSPVADNEDEDEDEGEVAQLAEEDDEEEAAEDDEADEVMQDAA